MHINAVWHRLAVHLWAEGLVAEHHIVGDDSGAKDIARAVDILDKSVKRLDALFEAALEDRPFRSAHDAGQHVKRYDTLGGLVLPIQRKGDANAPEHQFRLTAALFKQLGRQILQ